MIENLVNKKVGVRGRPPEHYLAIFPEVFQTEPHKGLTLIIGPGLSNISLRENTIGLDPVFLDPSKTLKHIIEQNLGSDEIFSIVNIESHLRQLRLQKKPNKHIVAGLASPDIQLPFAYKIFDSIVSSNCIFGGLDQFQTPDQLTSLIDRVFKHITDSGSLYLFPYFTQAPYLLPFSSRQQEELLSYSLAYDTQRQTLDKLRQLNYTVNSKLSLFRNDKIPYTLSTVKIST